MDDILLKSTITVTKQIIADPKVLFCNKNTDILTPDKSNVPLFFNFRYNSSELKTSNVNTSEQNPFSCTFPDSADFQDISDEYIQIRVSIML